MVKPHYGRANKTSSSRKKALKGGRSVAVLEPTTGESLSQAQDHHGHGETMQAYGSLDEFQIMKYQQSELKLLSNEASMRNGYNELPRGAHTGLDSYRDSRVASPRGKKVDSLLQSSIREHNVRVQMSSANAE